MLFVRLGINNRVSPAVLHIQKEVEPLEVCKKKPLEEDMVVAQQILLILLESDRVAEGPVLMDPCCFKIL